MFQLLGQSILDGSVIPIQYPILLVAHCNVLSVIAKYAGAFRPIDGSGIVEDNDIDSGFDGFFAFEFDIAAAINRVPPDTEI